MLILKGFWVLPAKDYLQKAPSDLTGLYLISPYLCADQKLNNHFTPALISLANLPMWPTFPGTISRFIPPPSAAYRGKMWICKWNTDCLAPGPFACSRFIPSGRTNLFLSLITWHREQCLSAIALPLDKAHSAETYVPKNDKINKVLNIESKNIKHTEKQSNSYPWIIKLNCDY